jgi:hypothetical protein
MRRQVAAAAEEPQLGYKVPKTVQEEEHDPPVESRHKSVRTMCGSGCCPSALPEGGTPDAE